MGLLGLPSSMAKSRSHLALATEEDCAAMERGSSARLKLKLWPRLWKSGSDVAIAASTWMLHECFLFLLNSASGNRDRSWCRMLSAYCFNGSFPVEKFSLKCCSVQIHLDAG